VIALVVLAQFLPVKTWLSLLSDWWGSAGLLGWLVFFGAYVLAAVLLLPGSVLTLGAGVAFGFSIGLPLVVVSAAAASSAAFFVSRYLARDLVMRRFGHGRRFRAVDQAVAREGTKIVFMLRLSPVVPYNVLNYILGLTGIRFWNYLFASVAGSLPATILYVYICYASREGVASLLGASGMDKLKLVYLIIGLIVTAVATYYLTRLARHSLQQYSDVAGKSGGASGNTKSKAGS